MGRNCGVDSHFRGNDGGWCSPFDRLRPNVLPRGHMAVTDTPAWPQTRGVTLLKVNGVCLFDCEAGKGITLTPALTHDE